MVTEGIVLGHKISATGLEVDQSKVSIIKTLAPPTTVKGVRSFLGHAGFLSEIHQGLFKNSQTTMQITGEGYKIQF